MVDFVLSRIISRRTGWKVVEYSGRYWKVGWKRIEVGRKIFLFVESNRMFRKKKEENKEKRNLLFLRREFFCSEFLTRCEISE